MQRKLVQFGAGNIGRSFIGQLFARSGYDVVFVDINEQLVKALNERKAYQVVIKRNQLPDEILWVRNVRAVDGRDRDLVAKEIAGAAILATAVGQHALPHIFPVLAEGLRKRIEQCGRESIDIIIAENIRHGACYFAEELGKSLGGVEDIKRLVGLVETSIGKMVPLMTRKDIDKDPLWIFAEPYNTLIVDKHGFVHQIPDVDGLSPVENIAAYVDRKLFIHNLGHAAAAYLGYAYNPDIVFMYKALAIPDVYQKTRQCMEQSAVALHKAYPEDLTLSALHEHVDDLLERFQNRSLGDTIFRVGRDLPRKFHKDDRLVGAMLLAKKYGCPCNAIAEAVIAGCKFRATDEAGDLSPEDKLFAEQDYPAGLEHILTHVCQLSRANKLEADVTDEIMKNYKD